MARLINLGNGKTINADMITEVNEGKDYINIVLAVNVGEIPEMVRLEGEQATSFEKWLRQNSETLE